MRNRRRRNPFLTGLITAFVLLALMAGVFVSGIPAGPQIPVPWNQKMTLKVQLANADALAPHASVEIGGVKVGEVQSVDAQGSLAVATLQIQQQYADVHRDATIYLRAHGLFGPKYIAIVPGTASSPALQDGDTINVARTVQPVDLDAVLQALQAPEAQNLRTTIVELGAAAAGRGSDVNHLIAAADSLAKVLPTPLKALDNVSPQLSDMFVQDEAFNNYFAQTPLDQLIANSEQTVRVFAQNSDHLQSILIHADSSLSTLDQALNGEPGNIATIVKLLGQQGGVVDKLSEFSYLLGLFGANLTGQERSTNPADQDVTGGIIGAISNVASAFYYSDACGATAPPPAPINQITSQAAGPPGDNHCSMSPDGRQHFLHVRSFNIVPNNSGPPTLPTVCIPITNLPLPIPIPSPLQQTLPSQVCLPTLVSDKVPAPQAQSAGAQLSGFGALFAS